MTGTALESLPRLIREASAALAKAESAAEVLDAFDRAKFAYDQAKAFAHTNKAKEAFDTIVLACRRVQADALNIEVRAQCRLADEFDSAQSRGEVAKRGRQKGSKKEHLATTADIGLTRKQVHEARQIRDAEKKNPGAIKKAIDQKVAAGKEPTRADVKRATRPSQTIKPKPPTKRQEENAERNLRIIALADQGMPANQIAIEVDLGERVVHQIIEHERERRGAVQQAAIDPATLSMTAQEKLEAAIRQVKRKLEIEFEQKVQDECARRLNEISLPSYAKELRELEHAIKHRQGKMDKATYKLILSCLHPDLVEGEATKRRFAKAFAIFSDKAMVKRLLDERESPTEFTGMPQNYAEWMQAKAKATADRRAAAAARKAGKTNIQKR